MTLGKPKCDKPAVPIGWGPGKRNAFTTYLYISKKYPYQKTKKIKKEDKIIGICVITFNFKCLCLSWVTLACPQEASECLYYARISDAPQNSGSDNFICQGKMDVQ